MNYENATNTILVKYYAYFADGTTGQEECHINADGWNRREESPLTFSRRHFSSLPVTIQTWHGSHFEGHWRPGCLPDEIVGAKVVEVWGYDDGK
jgi:hypothetical protein